jgi:hypothetical protein
MCIKISVPSVGRGSPWLRVGDEKLESAPPGGKLLGSLEGPKYSVFCIFALGHLSESEWSRKHFELSEEDEGGDKM